MWIIVGEGHSYRVLLCASSRATHVVWLMVFTPTVSTVAHIPSKCHKNVFFWRSTSLATFGSIQKVGDAYL